ncbi:MAG TPA: hypothetical protein VGL59_06000 [Polyangia bacterium]|jgi:hypothetical protein
MERVVGSSAEGGIQRHLDTIWLALVPLSEMAKSAGATLPGPIVGC